jgi:hypothetical protein
MEYASDWHSIQNRSSFLLVLVLEKIVINEPIHHLCFSFWLLLLTTPKISAAIG